MPENEQIIKSWSDWSAGIGFAADDGQTPGMYSASALLGLRGELRVAPFLNTVATGIVAPLSIYNFVNTTLTFAHTAMLLKPAAGSTVIILGTATSAKGNGTSLTIPNHTVPAGTGTKRVLTVTVFNNSAANPTGVTWNGTAMTLSNPSTGNPRCSQWKLEETNIPTGSTTADVVASIAAGVDLIAVAQAYDNVDQTTSVENSGADSGTASKGFSALTLSAVALNGMMVDACVINTTADNVEPEAGQTSILEDSLTTIRGRASYRAVNSAGTFHFMYYFEGLANTDNTHPFLYAERGTRFGGVVVWHKIDLSNSDFATLETSSHSTALLQLAGQAAKYQGFWWLPTGNDDTPRKLSVIGTGSVSTDTLDAPATPFEPGADHLVSFGNQMAGVVAKGVAGVPGLGGIGAQPGGVRILKVDGAPATGADWGAEFPAGDATDRAGGLLNLHGSTYVMMPDGLYSFNKVGRSGMVLSDLGEWRNFHQNILWGAWKGGIMIPHPSGLIFYVPGSEPEYVGIGARSSAQVLPPAGVTSIYGGYYHSVALKGDYVYVVYQPDPSSTSAFLLCGYRSGGEGMTWQVLASLTLLDVRTELGCHVATSGKPIANTYVTPTVWSQSGANLVYVVLDGSGGPFRGRADTHRVATSADAFMSEIEFAEPQDLKRVVVYTSSDMADGDEWQISLIADGISTDINVGAPIKGTGIRHERRINRHSVSRAVLHVTFTGTSTAARVAPAIKRIDLWSTPTRG